MSTATEALQDQGGVAVTTGSEAGPSASPASLLGPYREALGNMAKLEAILFTSHMILMFMTKGLAGRYLEHIAGMSATLAFLFIIAAYVWTTTIAAPSSSPPAKERRASDILYVHHAQRSVVLSVTLIAVEFAVYPCTTLYVDYGTLNAGVTLICFVGIWAMHSFAAILTELPVSGSATKTGASQ